MKQNEPDLMFEVNCTPDGDLTFTFYDADQRPSLSITIPPEEAARLARNILDGERIRHTRTSGTANLN